MNMLYLISGFIIIIILVLVIYKQKKILKNNENYRKNVTAHLLKESLRTIDLRKELEAITVLNNKQEQLINTQKAIIETYKSEIVLMKKK